MKKILGKNFEIIIVFLIWNIVFLFFGKVNAATSVSGGSVDVGDTITVNFSVTDNNGGFSGNVSYDTGKLEYVSSSVSGTGSYNNGSVAIVGGDSFSVTFKAKSSGSASVSLNNIMLGDGSSGSGSSATINIKSNAPAPTINENGGDVAPEAEEDDTPAAPAPVEEVMPNFTAVYDTIYATRSMNVRSGPSTNYSKVGGLYANQAVTRTGIGDNGWSKISYNGGTAYVLTALTTTNPPEEEEPEEPEEQDTPEENPENQETPPEETSSEEQPETTEENKPAEKTEEEIYNEIVSKVGTIPEVGTNYNIYAFALIVIVSIISFGIIIKNK